MEKRAPQTPKELAEFVEKCRQQRGRYTPLTPLAQETSPKVGHTTLTKAHAGHLDPLRMQRRTLDGILSLDRDNASTPLPAGAPGATALLQQLRPAEAKLLEAERRIAELEADIALLEAMLLSAGYHPLQIKARTPYVEVMGG